MVILSIKASKFEPKSNFCLGLTTPQGLASGMLCKGVRRFHTQQSTECGDFLGL